MIVIRENYRIVELTGINHQYMVPSLEITGTW